MHDLNPITTQFRPEILVSIIGKNLFRELNTFLWHAITRLIIASWIIKARITARRGGIMDIQVGCKIASILSMMKVPNCFSNLLCVNYKLIFKQSRYLPQCRLFHYQSLKFIFINLKFMFTHFFLDPLLIFL
jgi:hypothetical protein